MNRASEKAAKEQAGAGPQIVDLRERVPQMGDGALATLLENARRLLETGSKLQRTSAADLIPVVEAEIARRLAEKAAAAAAKKATAKNPKTTTSA